MTDALGEAALGTTRRTLVRGAAWSVPVVAVAATAPAFAASPCSDRYSYLLNWGATPYTRANARNGSATVASADSTAVTVTFLSTLDDRLNVPDPTRNLTVPANTGHRHHGGPSRVQPGWSRR